MKNNSIEQFIKQKHQKEQAIDKFIQWFGDSQITHHNGTPIILYHGTTHDISEFQPSFHWKENFLGDGFYFTNSEDDASDNYASLEGPDIKAKMDNRIDELTDLDADEYAEIFEMNIENIENMNEEELDEAIHQFVRKEQAGENLGNVIPVYIKMEKPFVFSLEDGHHMEWNIELDGNANDLEAIFQNMCEKHSELDDIDCIDHDIIYQEVKDEIISTNINDVEDLLIYLEEEHYDFKNFKENNEINFNIFFSDLKDTIIEHFGGELRTIELEEEFSGELYDFIEHLRNYIDRECNIPRNETVDSLIYKIHEKINLETFCDFSINAQELKDAINDIEDFCYLDYKETGDLFQLSKAFNEFIRDKDYDGIIMSPMEAHFKNMNHMDDLTRHYIVFEPNQIKSAVGNSGDYSLDHNDICYRLKPKSHPKAKINPENIERITEQFKEHFDLSIIFQSIEDSSIKGYTKSGTVYINENNINNEQDLIETLNHETFHIGFREKFGKDAKIYLDKAFRLFNESNELENIKKQYNLDFSKPEQRLKAAEEKIAQIAEQGGDLPYKNNLKGMINSNIKTLEEKIEKQIDFNYNDIETIVAESFNHLEHESIVNKLRKKPKL